MFEITIDISDVVEDYNLLLAESKNLSSIILDRIVDEYMIKWETLVGNSLRQTKDEYFKAMEVERPDDYQAIIRLARRKSKLALMIEDGADPFDIKEGLKKSNKRKISADGDWYIDVPFRFATTKAIAASPVFTGGVAPQGVINAAKKAGGLAVPLSKLPIAYQKSGIRKEINRNKIIPAYHHKVSIYAGIRRKETGTLKKKSGVYNTYRRVSDNSDQLSWMHKGFEAKKFMDKTLQNIEPEFDTIVDQIINDFLKKM